MTIRIEIFDRGSSKGSFDFEAPPRLGEKVKVEGDYRWWQVVDVRHLVQKEGPAQFQIAVERAAD